MTRATAAGLLSLALGIPTPASAQHYLEARGADTEYRYFDWNYTWPNAAIVDLFYVGVPGSNEFNLGGGYVFTPSPSWSVAPLAYAVLAEEGDQRGLKLAVLASFQQDGWKASAFLGHFMRLSGDVPNYQVLDTLDLTRGVGEHFECGISGGFFRTDGEWDTLVGPLAKWNDRRGYWAVSYRFGEEDELRATRVIVPTKR